MELGNALNWFEIPVTDFERAKKFYESIFDYQMPENQMGEAKMGFFLYDFQGGKVGGAIVKRPVFTCPANKGSLVYLNCQPDLQKVLDRLLQEAKPCCQKLRWVKDWEVGLITDTEGNRVALHSMG
jgi:predicted enzyme related to lactoylglutathione lyase